MAASYQAKNNQVLNQQLVVQEVCLFANNSLATAINSGADLNIQLGETVTSVLMVIKEVSAGTLTGVAHSIGSDGTSITLTGEGAAASTTSYLVKYTCAE